MTHAADQPTTEPACVFCGLPVRSRPHDDPQTPLYCCFGCRIAAGIAQGRSSDEGLSWMIARIGLAVFLSMNVMICSLVLYSQSFYEKQPSETATAFYGLLRHASLLLTLPVLLILGWPIFGNALAELRRRTITTDLLFSIGVAAAVAYSVVSTFRDSGETYYDTACMILIIATLGKWLEAHAKQRAAASIQNLRPLIPDSVAIVSENRSHPVKTNTVKPGQTIQVPPGQTVPLDGTLLDDHALFDEQVVTGESNPIKRFRGQSVWSGAIPIESAVRIRVTSVGKDTTLAQLIALTDRARKTRGRYERIGDRLAAVFVPTVACIAIVSAAIPVLRGDWPRAVTTFLAVTLISCPCAFGLATPLAVWTAIAAAARKGILFRNVEAVEKLAKIKRIFLDKTGTLTTAKPEVASFAPIEPNGTSPNDLIALAAGLARQSNHPAAAAIANFSRTANVPPSNVTACTTRPGLGVLGTQVDGNRRLALGNEQLLADEHIALDDRARALLADQKRLGRSTALLAVDGRPRAVVGLRERIRPEAHDALRHLRQCGLKPSILTGDHAEKGMAIADTLEVDVRAALTPEQKLETVRQAARSTPTAMVGDGLNDGPALAAADVGIAMGCGTDLAKISADVCLMKNDLRHLDWAVQRARRTVHVIRGNFFWAVCYNVVGIGLASIGRLHPVIAAGAMVASSLCVIANSRRLAGAPPQ